MKYKQEIKKCLEPLFSLKTATFDIGYSCRIESALKTNFNFDITPYYIHINNDLPFYRADRRNIDINTFYQYSPGVTGTLRELLISKMEPSCKSLEIVDGKLKPVFKEYHLDYFTKYIIGNIQSNALNFVDDMVNIFGKDLEYLYYQREDAGLIHEYFSSMPKYIDKQIFSVIEFEDDLGAGRTFNLLDFWNNQINDVTWSLNNNMDTSLKWINPIWKRAICLYFLDRNLLKHKVNERWKEHPFRLKATKYIYKFLRKIYREMKR